MALDEQDKRWILAQLERVETNLLTEFHKWASPVDARQRSYREQVHALELELDGVKDRIAKLEKTTG